jgi:hypothetical protein
MRVYSDPSLVEVETTQQKVHVGEERRDNDRGSHGTNMFHFRASNMPWLEDSMIDRDHLCYRPGSDGGQLASAPASGGIFVLPGHNARSWSGFQEGAG